MSEARDAALAELARRELARREQENQAAQTQPSPQLSLAEQARQGIAQQAIEKDAPTTGAALTGAIRGAQRIGANLAEGLGVGQLGTLGNLKRGLEARGEPVPEELAGAADVPAALASVGQVASPQEQALVEQAPVTSALSQELPGALVPITKGAQATSLGQKLLESGIEAAVQGQLTSTAGREFDADIEQAGTDALFGSGFRAALSSLGGIGRGFAKFGIAPRGLVEKKAAADIAKWSTLSSEEVAKRSERVKQVFGKDADLIGLSEVTGEIPVANREAAFAVVQSPEKQAALAARAKKLDSAVESKLSDFRNFFPLNEQEADLVKKAYANLSTVRVPEGRWQDLMNDPIMKEVGKDLSSSTFSVTKEAIESYPVNSVAFWDEVKQFVGNRAWSGNLEDAKKVAAYKDLTRRINAMNKAAADGKSEFALAQRMSQRKIIGEQLDGVFKRLREGAGEGAPLQRKSVRAALANQNWGRIEDALQGIADEGTRKEALRNARVLKQFTQDLEMSLDPKRLAKESEEFAPGGAFSALGGFVGNFTKGRYNAIAMELIHDPDRYTDVLKGIERMDKEARVRTLSRILASGSTEDVE